MVAIEKENPKLKDVLPKDYARPSLDKHRCVLTPGQYVGAEEVEDDGIPFEEKMCELSTKLYEQFAKADELEARIKKNLETLKYGE